MTKEIPNFLMACEPHDRAIAFAYWEGVFAMIALPGTPAPDWLPALCEHRLNLVAKLNCGEYGR